MFNLFNKKSEIEKLEIQYRKLLEEAYKLSTSNRTQSDSKTFEANEVLKKIDVLKSST